LKKKKESQEKEKDGSAEDSSSKETPENFPDLAEPKDGLLSTKPLTKPSILKKLFMQLFSQISNMVQGGAIYKDVDIDGQHKKMKFKEQYNGFHDNTSDKTLAFYNIEINVNSKPEKIKENSTEVVKNEEESPRPAHSHTTVAPIVTVEPATPPPEVVNATAKAV
jgi:hypothetical protein